MIATIDGDSFYCKGCDTVKPVSDFHKDSKSKRGFTYHCKVCANARSRKWTAEHGHTTKYRESKWNAYYKNKYKISLEDRLNLLKQQEYKCKICGIDLNPSGTHTHTDHCHTTGQIRGILCTNCNRGLGHFQDNKEFLMNAIKYLDNFDVQQEGRSL